MWGSIFYRPIISRIKTIGLYLCIVAQLVISGLVLDIVHPWMSKLYEELIV